MSTEIKLMETDVIEVLDELNSSIHSMQKCFVTKIEPDGNLSMIQMLNEINNSLTQLLDTYQTFLTISEEQTRKSVQVLNQTDKKIASQMQQLIE